MGLIVDTNVFIQWERRGGIFDLSSLDPSEDVFISVVTVSELLMGVHRAEMEIHRKKRSDFVEAIISSVAVLDFTTAVARQHARLVTDLARRGQLIGAHDMIVAATALHHGMSLLSGNVDEFSRVPNLRLIPFAR
jgi:tRNA(fMet)-specific endonuclease VapC